MCSAPETHLIAANKAADTQEQPRKPQASKRKGRRG
jgi:hypothetical protein